MLGKMTGVAIVLLVCVLISKAYPNAAATLTKKPQKTRPTVTTDASQRKGALDDELTPAPASNLRRRRKASAD